MERFAPCHCNFSQAQVPHLGSIHQPSSPFTTESALPPGPEKGSSLKEPLLPLRTLPCQGPE